MSQLKVCTKCQIELRPHESGVVAMSMATFGPYELYGADVWYCPSCKWKGIFGFTPNPFARHHDSDFESKLAELKRLGRTIIEFWLNDKEKPSHLRDSDAPLLH